jgi:hypothetical protein
MRAEGGMRFKPLPKCSRTPANVEYGFTALTLRQAQGEEFMNFLMLSLSKHEGQ